LHAELLSKLQELDNHYDPLHLADPRLKIITETVDQIKGKLKNHVFANAEEEVYYFKFVLAPTLALHTYYADKMEWDRIIRLDSAENRYRFHDRVYSQAENFRKKHGAFLNYIRDGRNVLDNVYFLRTGSNNSDGSHNMAYIIDPSSPPFYCGVLATWIAHTKMELELKKTVDEEPEKPLQMKRGKRKLRWTGKQIELVELGYALHATGSFNDGKANLKDIFEFFEEAFEVDPGNTSRLFQDILRRQTGYTAYLDMMIEKLHKRIDDIETDHLN